jgi:hypothetical protein
MRFMRRAGAPVGPFSLGADDRTAAHHVVRCEEPSWAGLGTGIDHKLMNAVWVRPATADEYPPHHHRGVIIDETCMIVGSVPARPA